MTMTSYADLISMTMKMPIVDKTGIEGKYNIFLNSRETGGDDTSPSIFTALPEQLGLKLEAEKIPFKIFVIDHAEKPAESER